MMDHHTAPSSLFDAANSCVKTGFVCSDHCLQAFAAVLDAIAGSSTLDTANCRQWRHVQVRETREQKRVDEIAASMAPRKIEITFADLVFSPHSLIRKGMPF
jgi:hypothetical protein